MEELNQFCNEVAFAEPVDNPINLWAKDWGYAFLDANCRPTLFERAKRIVSSNNVVKALNGYRYLKNEKATGKLDFENYNLKAGENKQLTSTF